SSRLPQYLMKAIFGQARAVAVVGCMVASEVCRIECVGGYAYNGASAVCWLGERVQPIIGLIKTMRPRQWTKNVLVYAGLAFDGQMFNPEAFLRVTAAFLLLCLISGSVYIINDLADLESDRQHPTKRRRPLASGQVPLGLARAAAVVLPLAAFALAAAFSPAFAVVGLAYFLLQLLYSFWLKRIVILDVLTVMMGFVLRVLAGVVVIHVAQFSPWLYASTALLALFLIIGKRRQELLQLAEQAGSLRVTLRHYNLPLLDDMLRMVMTGTLITYLLYTIEAPSPLLAGTNLALLTVPFVLYGIFRYLYLMHVNGEGSAPDEVLFKDRPLQIAIVLWGVTFLAILYLPG
ncbi:MAG TPA: decaprenyl-phosphate phosphoribosyltransferase, partial [Candidatus Limnocylindrales bacterium]|nr:decaprenyl-phosphate phosphoribosyltransferase [Candidatus Limnocylindrales bacterium]